MSSSGPTSPLTANLKPFVKFDSRFRWALRRWLRRRDAGTSRSLVGIRTDDGRSIARQGYKLFRGGREVGGITSGTYAPSFERPLAMAYVATSAAIADGDHLEGRYSQSHGRRDRRPPYRFIAAPRNLIHQMRFIPHTEADVTAMLEAIGVTRLDDLIAHVARESAGRPP